MHAHTHARTHTNAHAPTYTQDAGTHGGAIDIEEGGSAHILDSTFNDNVSRNGSQWAASGAIKCYENVSISVSECTFFRNLAENGGDGAFAGARVNRSGTFRTGQRSTGMRLRMAA